MPYTDYATGQVSKQPVRVHTVDTEKRIVEGTLKDGAPISIAIFDIPPFFRWPKQDEWWMVYYENGFPRLGTQLDDKEAPIEGLTQGQAKINADRTFDANGRRVVTTYTDGEEVGNVVTWNGENFQLDPVPVSAGDGGGEIVGVFPTTSTLPQIIIDNPDANGDDVLGPETNFVFTVSDGRVGKVSVRLYLEHTYVGDILLRLTSPLGTEVELVSGNDEILAAQTGFGSQTDPIDFVFDDNAEQTWVTDSVMSSVTVAPPEDEPILGAWTPETPLVTFRGELGGGEWTLTAIDTYGGDEGSLLAAELVFVPSIEGHEISNWTPGDLPEVQPQRRNLVFGPGINVVDDPISESTLITVDSDDSTEYLDLAPLLNPGWVDWGYRSPDPQDIPSLYLARSGKHVSMGGMIGFDAEDWLITNVAGSDGRTLNDITAGESTDVNKSRFYGGRNIITSGTGTANFVGKNGARTGIPNASTGSIHIPLDWCPPNSVLLTCALDWGSSSDANQEYGDDPSVLSTEPSNANGFGTWARHRSPEGRGRMVQIFIQVLRVGSNQGGYMWIWGYSPQPPMRDYFGGYFDAAIPGDNSCGIVFDGHSWVTR